MNLVKPTRTNRIRELRDQKQCPQSNLDKPVQVLSKTAFLDSRESGNPVSKPLLIEVLLYFVVSR